MKTSLRYLDEFLRLKCAPDLITKRLFPNAKEITESMGAFNAVRDHLRYYQMGDKDVTVLVVGDGHTPRTGALFAHRTNWNVVSVDPLMNGKWKNSGIRRLYVLRDRIEDTRLERFRKLIVVCVHSHATLDAVFRSIDCPSMSLVSIPCCVPQWIEGHSPDLAYNDVGILSPHNEVRIWKHVDSHNPSGAMSC